MTVPMYIRLVKVLRNGLFLIHAIMLCKVQEAMSTAAVEDRYQPNTGGLKKMKNPLGIARASFLRVSKVD